MTPAGVTFLDHTADVGFEVAAPGPPELFHRAALGMLALLTGNEDDGPDVQASRAHAAPRGTEATAGRTIRLDAADPARLLADWLRELLLCHEVERLDYRDAAFDVLIPGGEGGPASRLEARVRFRFGGAAIREIKGVTYHAIEARPADGGWTARVIFDV